VLGVLAPELQRAFGWSEIQYSNIINAFQAAREADFGFIGEVPLRN
jgi:hypothetical protein